MFRIPFGKPRFEATAQAPKAKRWFDRSAAATRSDAGRQLEMLEDRTTPAILNPVAPNINISRAIGLDAEPTIAINPTDPQNILAASINQQSIFTDHQNIFRSTDGGLTWTVVEVDLPQGFAISNGDVGIVFDSDGRALLTHMGTPTNNPGGLGMISAVSTDGGLNWTPGIITDGTFGDDKVFGGVGIDKNNPTQQLFYSTWQRGNVIFASTSSDGVNWNVETQVSQGGGNIDSHIVVDANGDAYCFWQNFAGNLAGVIMSKSFDGGLTWSAETVVATSQVRAFENFFGYSIPAQPDRGADLWLSVDIDKSNGPFAGRVYVCYVDQADNDANPATQHDNTDVYIISSADGGATWTAAGIEPTRVNDDFPAGQNSQFFPWMSVDQATGNIGISWYDARNDVFGGDDTDGVENDEVQFFAAVSDDGGSTFSQNIVLSDGVSISHTFFFDPFGFNFGDYTASAFFNGNFYAVWADNSNSTGNNPNGTRNQMDMVLGRAQVGVAAAVDSVAINPVFDINPTGTFHTVTATVLDVNAQPIRGASVVFVVTGANGLLTATAYTDVNGIATISYVGNAAGFDNIAVFAGLATDAGGKQWVGQTQISGIVYVDNNGNGTVDPGELGIPNVTINLNGNDFLGNVASAQAFTDASGAFTFTALFPSDANGYTITEVQPAAYLDGTTRTTSKGTAGVNVIFGIVLAEGESAAGFFFGERGLLPTFVSKRFFFSDAGTNVIPGNVLAPEETKALAGFAPAGPALPAAIQQGVVLPDPLFAQRPPILDTRFVHFGQKTYVPSANPIAKPLPKPANVEEKGLVSTGSGGDNNRSKTLVFQSQIGLASYANDTDAAFADG